MLILMKRGLICDCLKCFMFLINKFRITAKVVKPPTRLYVSSMSATSSLTHGRYSRQHEQRGSQASVQVLWERPPIYSNCV